MLTKLNLFSKPSSSIFLVVLVTCFGWAHSSPEWVIPEGARVPTVFYQGILDSHKQCAKYCGPDGFRALTGQHVRCPNSIPLIHTPFIGKELDEIKLQPDTTLTSYHPIALVDAVQRHIFAKQIGRYGYQVSNLFSPGPTLATHAMDFFKMNLAQERDIEECSKKVNAANSAYPENNNKILWGVSRGAAAVFNAHARHNFDGVRMIVLEGCLDTIDHTIALRSPWLLTQLGGSAAFTRFLEIVSEYRRDGISPMSSVDSFPEGVPVVFITSKADRSVPMACTFELIRKLKARGKNPVHVLVLNDSGHNHYALGDGQDQIRYRRFMHRLYKKYNLPYVPEYLKNQS